MRALIITPVIDVVLEKFILLKLQDMSQFLQGLDGKCTYHNGNVIDPLQILITPTASIVKACMQGKIPYVTL